MNLEKKYKSLIEREFKKELDIYITFNKCGLFDTNNFEDFIKTDNLKMEEIRKVYTKLYQTNENTITINGKNIDIIDLDNKLDKWYKSKDYIILKDKWKSKYEEHFEDKISFPKIEKILKQYEEKCFYCGLNEDTINEMLKKNLFNTVRFYYNRGRSLEIDRKNPFLGYKENNIVYCCYWCNNAKTDEFDDKEFKAIGSVINLIWKKRNCKK